MKILTTLGILLLFGGLGTADPIHHFWHAPSAYAEELHTRKHEHEHELHNEEDHAEHDHGQRDDEHAPPDDNHHHAEHGGREHDEHHHSADDHSEDDHRHEKNVGDKQVKSAHPEEDDGHEEHRRDEHAGHDHNEEGQEKHVGDELNGHAGHDHEEEGAIHLKPEVMREFNIEVRVAESGRISRTVRLPGEVVYNADRIAHVRPTVSGIAQQVHVSVGDRVESGQTMAILNSRELAVAQSEYLAATARLELARENLARDRRLFKNKIGTERAVMIAKQALREAEIVNAEAMNSLLILGYTHEQITRLTKLEDASFNTYEMHTPLSGIVTQRHITVGEIIELDDDAPFVVADLSTVWVDVTIYQRNLSQVHKNMPVTIEFGADTPNAKSTIHYVSPALNQTTRTATARVVLDNPLGKYRPGQFVSAQIETDHVTAEVVVPNSALTDLDGKTVVFVQSNEGFEPRHVVPGRSSPQVTEILEGLDKGERYAANNVLVLKTEMNRAALEHAGHVH